MQKLYFAITITTLIALAGTAAVDPSIIRELAQEDHILENTTVAFLGASFVGLSPPELENLAQICL